MKFGFFLNEMFDQGRRPRYAPTYELCQRAEAAGFDFVTMGHHRFTPGHTQSSTITTLAAIAAQTTTLRLSSAVFLLPLYPALDVAEQIAVLDQISDGRTMLSFGLGYREYEYTGAGLEYRHRGSRMEEALQILRQAWTQDAVHFKGRHYDINGVPVTPRPLQQPNPPIWLGGGSNAGVDRAARLADGWMIDSTKTLSSAQHKAAMYRSAAAALGRPSQVCLVRQVGIGSTRQEVEDVWLPDIAQQLMHVFEAGGRFPGGEQMAAKIAAGERLELEEFTQGRDIAGTPDEVIAQIKTFQDATGCEYFCGIFGDNPDFDTAVRAIELFGREVIPAFT